MSTEIITSKEEMKETLDLKKNMSSGYTNNVISCNTPTVLVTPAEKDLAAVTRRKRGYRRTTFQARLGRKLDNIANRVLDNNIRLTAHPTDMLRIVVTRDTRSQDLISRTVQSTEIMPIILPNMVDIPLRQLKRGNEDGGSVTTSDVMIPSLYSTMMTQDYFEVYAPVECNLNEDDLLIRILYDSSPNVEEPYIMVLQVKEILATFGYSSLMWKKVIVTFYDETMPKKIIDIIKQDIEKREKIDY